MLLLPQLTANDRTMYTQDRQPIDRCTAKPGSNSLLFQPAEILACGKRYTCL